MSFEDVRSFAAGCVELASICAFLGAVMLWADAVMRV